MLRKEIIIITRESSISLSSVKNENPDLDLTMDVVKKAIQNNEDLVQIYSAPERLVLVTGKPIDGLSEILEIN